MSTELGLKEGCTVADVGSGTRIFADLLLKVGCHVIGVEPNPEMRKAAETALFQYPKFKSVDGRSEKTGIRGATADFIVAAQAYHWFEPTSTKTEFQRILKPGGWMVLIWNDRKTTASPFATQYQQLIQTFSTAYC